MFLFSLVFPAHRVLALGFLDHGPSTPKQVALTFDADMTPFMKKQLNTGKVSSYYNFKIIDYLNQEKIPATLFLTGMWAEIYKSETKALSQNPLFEIGNHTYSHPGFSQPCYGLAKIKNSQKSFEITRTQDIIKTLTGLKPRLFRFPGGCHKASDIDLVNSLGLTVVGWNISSTDAFNKNPNSIVHQVLNHVTSGSIIVFHLHGGPNAPATLPAFKQIVPNLQAKGYNFVKVSQLI